MDLMERWITEHRFWLLGILALSFWVAANYWYFRRDIARIKRESAPHSWSVDMASKTTKGGRKVIR